MTTWVSQLKKVNHSGFYWSKRWWGGTGISWTTCKSFAPRCSGCRQINTPVPPHHSVFTGRMPLLPPSQQCKALKRQLNLALVNFVLFFVFLLFCVSWYFLGYCYFMLSVPAQLIAWEDRPRNDLLLVLLRFQNVSCRSVSVGFAEKTSVYGSV